ncbi:MAG: alpha/beta hydrolase [Gemmatimonadaceae bacterium]
MIRKCGAQFCAAMMIAAPLLAGRSADAQERARGARSVVVAPGVSLNVVDVGERQPKAPTVVLIPGWSMGAAVWQDVITDLQRTRRVVALDPRSQGQSTITPYGNTPEQRARDLHVLLDSLHVVRPVLVGWSQGAQDVGAFVAEFGDTSVSALVLVDSPVSDGAAAVATRPAEAEALFRRLTLYEKYQREYLDGMISAITTHPSAEQRRMLIETGMRTPTSIGIAQLVADFYGPDRLAALAKTRVPTLVMASAQSPELDRQRDMAGRIAGARFESVADARHAVFIDQLSRFNALLASFLP